MAKGSPVRVRNWAYAPSLAVAYCLAPGSTWLANIAPAPTLVNRPVMPAAPRIDVAAAVDRADRCCIIDAGTRTRPATRFARPAEASAERVAD